jgi:hypothetical protein
MLAGIKADLNAFSVLVMRLTRLYLAVLFKGGNAPQRLTVWLRGKFED